MTKANILGTGMALILCIFTVNLHAQNADTVYRSDAYTIIRDGIQQGEFTAKAVSSNEIISGYYSSEATHYSPDVDFKFSINLKDNEMPSGMDHHITLVPVNGACETMISFGKQYDHRINHAAEANLPANTIWKVRLDLREVWKAFREKGYFTLFDGKRLYQSDFKSVSIAGSSAPLIWDFNNLHTKPELELKDPDGDGIYETTLIMNSKGDEKSTDQHWKLNQDISGYPQYRSGYLISDALYNLALEEMIRAVEPDSTFRTGKEWAGVWTRDISYSIILSMAYMQPRVAQYSLMKKVKNGRIIQDTGTGGAYPVSTDRIVWAVAAWEVYKVTGDMDWLKTAYAIIRKSIEDDMLNAYDAETGLVRGESSFLDWREQTYPRWMEPADIFESENLGTNAVHFQANRILSEMSLLLSDSAASAKFTKNADRIREGINKYLWMKDKGYYAQYIYGRNFKIISPRSEALGEALCILFGIADPEQARSIVRNVPVMDYGISCIYPQIPGIPPYHNNAVWPFVQTYWGLASAIAGNEQSVLESMASVYRPEALFLTNKENFVASTGDFAGTQINSSNMLWSLSGSIALVHKILFGIHFQGDSLEFRPFVPGKLSGSRQLTNFRYRDALLNISLEGSGNTIQSFELDGEQKKSAAIPASLKGIHTIKIVLNNNRKETGAINKVRVHFSPETPVVKCGQAVISWAPVGTAVEYKILRNGKEFLQTTATNVSVDPTGYSEYQVVAVDRDSVPSFASEPIIVANSSSGRTVQVEEYARKSDLKYQNFNGKGFVEISRSSNRVIEIPLQIEEEGVYSFCFRYANGNGPVNTQNKCAIRTLKVDEIFAGTFVFPQRGAEEWSNWGISNLVKMKLTKGKHILQLSYEPQNGNMNGDINQAMLDEMTIWKISVN